MTTPPPPPPSVTPPGPQPPAPGDPRPAASPPPFSVAVDLRARSAQDAFRVPFTVLDAIVAILAFFIGQLVVGLVVGIGSALVRSELSDTGWMAIATAATLVGLLAGIGWLAARNRFTWHLLGPVRPGALPVALGLAAGLVGTVMTYLINGGLAFVFQPDEPVDQQVLQDALSGGSSLVLALVVAVVLAPIAEEVLFRGVLFQALRSRVGLWPAAVMSSVLFTLVHVEIVMSQPLALVGLFSLGVLLAWAFHRTGSLLVPIIGHAVFNAISITLAVAVDRTGLFS